MTDKESCIKDFIISLYPEAVIEAYYWTNCEMIFQPYPGDDKRGSCRMRGGKMIISWDF